MATTRSRSATRLLWAAPNSARLISGAQRRQSRSPLPRRRRRRRYPLPRRGYPTPRTRRTPVAMVSAVAVVAMAFVLLPRYPRYIGRNWSGVGHARAQSQGGKTQRAGDRGFGDDSFQIHHQTLCNSLSCDTDSVTFDLLRCRCRTSGRRPGTGARWRCRGDKSPLRLSSAQRPSTPTSPIALSGPVVTKSRSSLTPTCSWREWRLCR
jgi:hypothetical protein